MVAICLFGENTNHNVLCVGYEVGSRTIKAIKVRYSNKENRLSFVDFVTCMLKFSSFCGKNGPGMG